MKRVYIIKRASMFFATTEFVTYQKLNEYFTARAISIMQKDGFIQELDESDLKDLDPEKIKDVLPIK